MSNPIRQAAGVLFGFTITERYIFRIVTRWFFMLTFFVIGLSYLMKCADQIHNVGEGGYTMLTIAESDTRFLVVPEDAAEGEIVQNISQEAEDLHAEIWNQFKNACN